MTDPQKEPITYFAKTNFRNQMVPFGIKQDDRRRHMYIIGKTGMGKTTLLENLILSDIYNGFGCCYVDPHGDTAEKLIDYIPKHRINDVVYFNPADVAFPVGFNILEAVDEGHKHLVASGMMAVFKKIWENMWSSRMEYILNNTILALMDNPGTTLLGINRMLSDEEYRKRIVGNVKDPVVRQFWLKEFASYNAKYAQEAVAPIQNKIGQFLSAAVIRNIVAQVKSTINIRDVMDKQKILIINLSKGRIGEDSSRLLGGLLISKLQLSAMERVDTPEHLRKDFYLYVDEFQNFAVESFASILSEARKYRLCLTMAHQYIGQLTEEVRDAVFGNVGTIVTFRVGSPDAIFMEQEFVPRFTPEDIINLPKFNIYLKLLINGVTSQPFSAATLPPIAKQTNSFDTVVRVSRERYANPREEIEDKVLKWSGLDGVTDDDLLAEAAEKKKAVKKAEQRNRRPMHKYNCTRCDKAFELPVELDRSRPIYCETCVPIVKEERKNGKRGKGGKGDGSKAKKEAPKVAEGVTVQKEATQERVSLSSLMGGSQEKKEKVIEKTSESSKKEDLDSQKRDKAAQQKQHEQDSDTGSRSSKQDDTNAISDVRFKKNDRSKNNESRDSKREDTSENRASNNATEEGQRGERKEKQGQNNEQREKKDRSDRNKKSNDRRLSSDDNASDRKDRQSDKQQHNRTSQVSKPSHDDRSQNKNDQDRKRSSDHASMKRDTSREGNNRNNREDTLDRKQLHQNQDSDSQEKNQESVRDQQPQTGLPQVESPTAKFTTSDAGQESDRRRKPNESSRSNDRRVSGRNVGQDASAADQNVRKQAHKSEKGDGKDGDTHVHVSLSLSDLKTQSEDASQARKPNTDRSHEEKEREHYFDSKQNAQGERSSLEKKDRNERHGSDRGHKSSTQDQPDYNRTSGQSEMSKEGDLVKQTDQTTESDPTKKVERATDREEQKGDSHSKRNEQDERSSSQKNDQNERRDSDRGRNSSAKDQERNKRVSEQSAKQSDRANEKHSDRSDTSDRGKQENQKSNRDAESSSSEKDATDQRILLEELAALKKRLAELESEKEQTATQPQQQNQLAHGSQTPQTSTEKPDTHPAQASSHTTERVEIQKEQSSQDRKQSERSEKDRRDRRDRSEQSNRAREERASERKREVPRQRDMQTENTVIREERHTKQEDAVPNQEQPRQENEKVREKQAERVEEAKTGMAFDLPVGIDAYDQSRDRADVGEVKPKRKRRRKRRRKKSGSSEEQTQAPAPQESVSLSALSRAKDQPKKKPNDDGGSASGSLRQGQSVRFD